MYVVLRMGQRGSSYSLCKNNITPYPCFYDLLHCFQRKYDNVVVPFATKHHWVEPKQLVLVHVQYYLITFTQASYTFIFIREEAEPNIVWYLKTTALGSQNLNLVEEKKKGNKARILTRKKND